MHPIQFTENALAMVFVIGPNIHAFTVKTMTHAEPRALVISALAVNVV